MQWASAQLQAGAEAGCYGTLWNQAESSHTAKSRRRTALQAVHKLQTLPSWGSCWLTWTHCAHAPNRWLGLRAAATAVGVLLSNIGIVKPPDLSKRAQGTTPAYEGGAFMLWWLAALLVVAAALYAATRTRLKARGEQQALCDTLWLLFQHKALCHSCAQVPSQELKHSRVPESVLHGRAMVWLRFAVRGCELAGGRQAAWRGAAGGTRARHVRQGVPRCAPRAAAWRTVLTRCFFYSTADLLPAQDPVSTLGSASVIVSFLLHKVGTRSPQSGCMSCFARLPCINP